MLTTLTAFFERSKRIFVFVAKCAVPAFRAKRVLFPPMPTFEPAKKCVPRCKTKICPAFANWPSVIFTPRYLGFESRPRREEPVALLVAI